MWFHGGFWYGGHPFPDGPPGYRVQRRGNLRRPIAEAAFAQRDQLVGVIGDLDRREIDAAAAPAERPPGVKSAFRRGAEKTGGQG